MNTPAEIYRIMDEGDQAGIGERFVAKGPLIIMLHGVMAMDAAIRENFRIRTPNGTLDAVEAENTLRFWSLPGLASAQ